MPKKLCEKGAEYVPDHAGIIEIEALEIAGKKTHLESKIIREAKWDTKARAFTEIEIKKMLHLVSMRYWKDYDTLTMKNRESIHQWEFDI